MRGRRATIELPHSVKVREGYVKSNAKQTEGGDFAAVHEGPYVNFTVKVTKSLKPVDAHVYCHKVALLDRLLVFSWSHRISLKVCSWHVNQHTYSLC